jgi:hypothetical protein
VFIFTDTRTLGCTFCFTLAKKSWGSLRDHFGVERFYQNEHVAALPAPVLGSSDDDHGTYSAWPRAEFLYPKGIHNVLEVKKADYDSRTNSTPIATHTSGDDKIVIKSSGHRFFICGVPGHCAAGQKVNIRVLKPRSSDAPSPAPARATGPSLPWHWRRSPPWRCYSRALLSMVVACVSRPVILLPSVCV